MLNRIFVVDSVTLSSTGTAVSSYVPWDQTTRKLPTQVVVKATGQGAYVRLSNDNSAATNVDVLVQGGDHVVLSVQGRRWVSVLSDGASSTVSVGALSTGVSGDAASLSLSFAGATTLDPRITFTRASSATFTGSNGLIQSATTNTPRFDYDPVTLAAKGLLIEEQRTNLATYSEDFSNAAWVKSEASITADAATAPDGATTGDKLVENTSALAHRIFAPTFTPSLIAYSFSFYAKAAGRNYAYIRINNTGGDFIAGTIDLVNATVTQTVAGALSAVSVGNGWVRVIGVGTPATTATATPEIRTANSATYANYTGDGTSGIFLWGAQLEAGAFATSYIPTVASQVTRSADVASVNTLSPWYNATEGTIYIDYVQPSVSGAIAFIGDDTFNNSLRFNITNMARGSGLGFPTVVQLGIAQNGTKKLAVAIKSNDYAGVFNGGVVATQNPASMVSSPSMLGIGRDCASLGYMNGHIRRITYYPRRLSNAELVSITT